MDLALATGEQALEAIDHGWFQGTAPATHGDDYAFRLDGGEERPDPASRWQPDGVHGRSRLWDPQRAAWPATEAGWRAPDVRGGVVYELHVGTFTPDRTLDAAAAQLDHLVDLGVTHVELLPLNAFNGDHGWGYDGVQWSAVDEVYGGPDALVRFVAAAHALGLAVVVDAVYNHLGPSGNYLGDFGPYLSDRYRTPWGDCLNLDGPGADPVRALIVQSALRWLIDHHADALRLDAVHGLIDTSSVHVVTELAAAVAAAATTLRRPLQLVAESDRNDPLTTTPREQGGQGVDAQWADDLHHAIHVAVTGEREGYYADYTGLADVAAAYRGGFVFDGSRHSAFRQRTVGAPLPAGASGHRLVTCVQNHDQVGNRAAGDRLTTLVDADRVRAAAALLCASPTTPMLFMGEEYGETAPFQFFTSHPEPELAEAVRTGRRDEFAGFAAFAGAGVPDPQAPATLARSTLDHSVRETEAGRQRHALWRDLLALRRRERALGNGRRDLVTVEEMDAETLTLIRSDPSGPAVLVAANLSDAARSLPLPAPATDPRVLLSTSDPRYGGPGAASVTAVAVTVPPRSVALVRLAPDRPS